MRPAGSSRPFGAIGPASAPTRNACQRSAYAPDDQPRRVGQDGAISFHRRDYAVGLGFRGQTVAVRPTATDGSSTCTSCTSSCGASICATRSQRCAPGDKWERMCKPCPRTGVSHVYGLYRSRLPRSGSPTGLPRSGSPTSRYGSPTSRSGSLTARSGSLERDSRGCARETTQTRPEVVSAAGGAPCAEHRLGRSQLIAPPRLDRALLWAGSTGGEAVGAVSGPSWGGHGN